MPIAVCKDKFSLALQLVGIADHHDTMDANAESERPIVGTFDLIKNDLQERMLIASRDAARCKYAWGGLCIPITVVSYLLSSDIPLFAFVGIFIICTGAMLALWGHSADAYNRLSRLFALLQSLSAYQQQNLITGMSAMLLINAHTDWPEDVFCRIGYFETMEMVLTNIKCNFPQSCANVV